MRGLISFVAQHALAFIWNAAALVFLGTAWHELAIRDNSRTENSVLLLGAGALCGLIGNADRFEVLKVFGLEARMRRAVVEAEDVLQRLRAFAADLGAVVIHHNAGLSRWADPGIFQRQDAQKREVLRSLEKLGVSPEQLREARAADKVYVLQDYTSGVMSLIRKHYPGSAERRAEVETEARSAGRPITAGDLRKLAVSLGPVPPDVAELLADIEHYEAHGEHRRPEVWAQRRNW
ncbi:hypothetical protein DFH01_00260 [Falsiroseomonas bella]|uniref:Uncharacterized protein n=1 Tax=Falsiroseomonas bella TaxID=2184016 RepID=A0A317FFC5_9PROT|nr:hypothetical protein DFH01_00260 [Falsiroseomonas bella]